MSSTRVRVTTNAPVVRIELDGDEQLNALDPTAIAALGEAFAAASVDESVHVVVLAGTGRAFCVGADLPRLPPDAGSVMAGANALVRELAGTTVPVVAVVHGVAAGFGVSLAAAADVVLAGESASFLFPFADLGLMPDGGLSYTLPKAVGRAMAADLVFSGRPLTATKAAEVGLVSRMVPDDELSAAVDDLVGRLSAIPRRTLALTKEALHASTRPAFEAALEREHVGQVELLTSPDFTQRSARWAR